MATKAEKKQIEYIERLQSQIGIEKQTVKDMSSYEASKLISELIAKTAKTKISDTRLEMAMREVFRIWEKRRTRHISTPQGSLYSRSH